MSLLPRRLTALVIASAATAGGLAAAAPAATAADACASLTAPVYRTINPKFPTQLLTPWQSESTGSVSRYGFSDNRGVLGYASVSRASGYTAVSRLYNPKTVDFMWATTDAEVTKAQASGYVKQKVTDFYAPTTASSCTVGVHRFVKGAHTRNAWDSAEIKSLTTAGWSDAGISFYVKPAATSVSGQSTPSASASATATASASASASPTATATPTATASATPTSGTGAGTGTGTGTTDGDDTFSIAVIGDTQGETTPWDSRFGDRTAWLAANAKKLDVRWALHTGDMTNWGWLEQSQYTVATKAMSKLADAGIPYSVTVGNHDTRAVGWDGVAGSTKYGGSGYASNPECATKLGAAACKSWLLVRETDEFNKAFPLSSMKNVGGTYEAGKIDNMWATFSANDTKWLVLTIEFAPRKTVVEWARKVVADHPGYNVVIEDHYYLEGDGSISGSDAGYGETSAKYLYDQIVSKYPNVKIVAGGHVGSYNTSRTDTVNGNTVLSYLGNALSNSNNPIRILTINTTTGKVTSTVYSNETATSATTMSTTTNTISITR